MGEICFRRCGWCGWRVHAPCLGSACVRCHAGVPESFTKLGENFGSELSLQPEKYGPAPERSRRGGVKRGSSPAPRRCAQFIVPFARKLCQGRVGCRRTLCRGMLRVEFPPHGDLPSRSASAAAPWGFRRSPSSLKEDLHTMSHLNRREFLQASAASCLLSTTPALLAQGVPAFVKTRAGPPEVDHRQRAG